MGNGEGRKGVRAELKIAPGPFVSVSLKGLSYKMPMATLSFSQARLIYEPTYFLPTELQPIQHSCRAGSITPTLEKGTPGHSILDSQLRLPMQGLLLLFPFTLTIEYSSTIGMQYDVKPMYKHAFPRSN